MGGCISSKQEASPSSSSSCVSSSVDQDGRNKILSGAEWCTEKEKRSEDANTGNKNGVAPRVVMLTGSCRYASMFAQQGRKGINQDTMTIWDDFCEEKGQIFCGVFDGHGPFGHKVARYVRDALPEKLFAVLESTPQSDGLDNVGVMNSNSCDSSELCSGDKSDGDHRLISLWRNGFVKAFEELDQDLKHKSNIDCICSGTTAVSIFRVREHLLVANLGDSRTILCTRDGKNRPVPIQLSTDHKPDVPSETERIVSCNGRAFALEEEPDVPRLWLPDDDSPGLAMSRAFGDFCLKEFGLIATPEVSHRIVSEKDEFLVLATDGIWDVLSNEEVVKIVSSTRKPSDAAKKLVKRAVRAWKRNHPTSKIDDCAVICIFLKELIGSSNSRSICRGKGKPSTTSLSNATAVVEAKNDGLKEEEYSALDGVSRANSILKLPRVLSSLSWRKPSFKMAEQDD